MTITTTNTNHMRDDTYHHKNSDDEIEIEEEEEEEEKKDSTTDTATTLFLAKDGIYYHSYMEQRAANIRYNEQKLKAVGLDGSFRRRFVGESVVEPSSAVRKRSFSTRYSNNNNSDTNVLRKSGRIRQQSQQRETITTQPSAPKSSSSSISSSARNSTTSHVLEEELPVTEDDDDETTKKTVRTTNVRRVPSRTAAAALNALPLSDRQTLRHYETSHPDWILAMEIYLRDVEHLSYPNYRNVLRQVEKLTNGSGITYTHWNDDVAFHEQHPISLSDDMNELYQEAVDFEMEHGRDLGNGT